jgi:hypothetical protein
MVSGEQEPRAERVLENAHDDVFPSARNAKLDFGEVRPTAIRVGVELRHSQPEVLCNGAPTVLASREVCARAPKRDSLLAARRAGEHRAGRGVITRRDGREGPIPPAAT